ncbi:serine hydrolase [Bifidobacterium leontopitheci]|uniref:Beta-lactamase class A-like protein n=1 Tax=Bifidobacterium leontopitheci TaxID=2650774 RepID=A0A6I1GWS3_9BIFI|nr:serine hydrolase [Bifidobacterium leontopitheci]KAB7790911.1 beta-lactamase class A-like protein [Bifidobacterium leontopitheci]
MMVCPNCGNPVSAADKFCMVCGQKLHGDDAASGAAAQGVPQQYYDGTTIVPIAMPGGGPAAGAYPADGATVTKPGVPGVPQPGAPLQAAASQPTAPMPSPQQPASQMAALAYGPSPSQTPMPAPVAAAAQPAVAMPSAAGAPMAAAPAPAGVPGSPTTPPSAASPANSHGKRGRIVAIVIGCVFVALIAAAAGLWAWSMGAAANSASRFAQSYLQDIADGDYAAAMDAVTGASDSSGDLLTGTDNDDLLDGVTSITDYGVDGSPASINQWPTGYRVNVHYSVNGVARSRTLTLHAANPIAAVRGEWTVSGDDQSHDQSVAEQLVVVVPNDIQAVDINAGAYRFGDGSGACSAIGDDDYPDFTDKYGTDFTVCRLWTWPGVYQVGPDAAGAFQVSATTGIPSVGQSGDGSDAAVQPVFFVYASGSGYDQVDAAGEIISGATASRNGDDEKPSKKSGKKSDDTAAAAPDDTKLSKITDAYSSDEVAVSAMFLDGSSTSNDSDSGTSDDAVANTNAARSRFVSAGLYLPVYLAAQDYDSSVQTNARTMMSKMDNDAGNQAILGMGGFDKVNGWLSEHGYDDTSFDRHFGDVQASNDGHENYSSTYDAVRMLAAVDQAGGTGLMTTDIAKEGVKVPSGMTVHAHRGQGIKNTWNYFIIAETSHGKAAIAVATQNQGKEKAAEIASKVLAEMDAELKARD